MLARSANPRNPRLDIPVLAFRRSGLAGVSVANPALAGRAKARHLPQSGGKRGTTG
jgi:hypothetical protein